MQVDSLLISHVHHGSQGLVGSHYLTYFRAVIPERPGWSYVSN